MCGTKNAEIRLHSGGSLLDRDLEEYCSGAHGKVWDLGDCPANKISVCLDQDGDQGILSARSSRLLCGLCL